MSSSEEFRAVYDAHFDFVWRSLRRLGVRDADVFDIAQRVFLTAHARLPGFEGRSRIATWLFGICRNMASDYRRSAPVRREVFAATEELDVLLSAQTEVQSGRHLTRAELAEALLEQLPEAQREVFVLFELEGLSGDEIAALLEIPVGTARSRLRLARETLTQLVAQLKAAQPESLQGVVG